MPIAIKNSIIDISSEELKLEVLLEEKKILEVEENLVQMLGKYT
jgi:hypothetical protein